MLISMIPIVGVMAETTRERDTIVFAGGNGTVTDPYLIENKYQLDNVRNNLSAHYRLINDIEFIESDFLEGGDFYNDGEGWEPIGLSDYDPFCGVFNGNGYSICGLRSTGDSSCVGLFGNNMGSIINLYLEDAFIETSYEWDNAFIGAFVGQNYATVVNCHSKNATIIARGITGGIIGENIGKISNCSSNGKISGDGIAIGGIVGCNQGDDYVVEYCTNDTDIDIGNSNCCEAGGIAGVNYGIVHNCLNVGSVSVDSTYDNCESIFEHVAVGGIAGNNSNLAKIIQSSNYGDVDVCAENTNAYCGGVVGLNWYGPVTDCYNRGSVSGLSKATLGGVIGIATNSGVFTNCYNSGKVISGYGSQVGGFFGGFENYDSIDYLISNCYYLETCKESTIDEIAVALDDSAMKNQKSYKNYDFDSVWTISDTDEYKYPTLINCGNKNIVSITIEALPEKTEYIANQESLDISDGAIKVIYDNGTEEIVDMYNAEIIGFDNTIVSEQEISVMYCGFTTNFTVNVSEIAEPTEPSTGEENKPTDSTEPSIGEEDKSTNPTEPSTGEQDKPTDPSVPETDPAEPSTGENDKPTDSTESTEPILIESLGDANGDGKVNVKDATQIQKAIAGILNLDETENLAADVDGNGKVNVKDATAIQKWVAGIETGFLIGEPIKK